MCPSSLVPEGQDVTGAECVGRGRSEAAGSVLRRVNVYRKPSWGSVMTKDWVDEEGFVMKSMGTPAVADARAGLLLPTGAEGPAIHTTALWPGLERQVASTCSDDGMTPSITAVYAYCR